MKHIEIGKRNNPTLVCVPGLFGSPNDFTAMAEPLSERFHLVILDSDPQQDRLGAKLIDENVLKQEIVSESVIDSILQILKELDKQAAYFLGISLGGKVVFEFASKFPQKFLGGVSSDVGPGRFEKSELFLFVDQIVREFNLDFEFSVVKENLRQLISDRSLRSMIQSQIYFPVKGGPGRWKSGLLNFGNLFVDLLDQKGIGDQLLDFQNIDLQLFQGGRRIQVLHASTMSGICSESLAEMKKFKSVVLHPVPGATHFLHVTHKQDLIEATINLLLTPYGRALSRQKESEIY